MNKYILKFSPDIVGSPVLAETILETKVVLNILRAKIDYNEGTVVVSIMGDAEKQKKVVEVLTKKGVEVTKLRTGINNDTEKCVDCGACIAVCPAAAISFNKENMEIVFDKEKCHRCGVCVEVCPRKSISIQQI